MKKVSAFLVVVSHVIAQQDLSIYGFFDYYTIPMNTREVGYVYAKCMEGLQFKSCYSNPPKDSFSLDQNLPYYNLLGTQAGGTLGTFYCLKCCGTPPSNIDYWNLSCPVNYATILTTNVYGYELRLATYKYAGDKGYVRCPLKRSACTYNGKETIECNKAMDKEGTYLIGYTATIEVAQYDDYFKYWRGALSCSIQSVERNYSLVSGEIFHENYVLIHTPNFNYSYFGYDKIAILIVFLYVVVYVTLYFCRRKHCVYCAKKLVFSMELCYMCKFYGVQPPDPVLMKALEEKTEQLQGKIPERFPGSTITLYILRKLGVCIAKFGNCCCLCGCCRSDGCCCCCCRLCSRRKHNENPYKIHPGEGEDGSEYREEEKNAMKEKEMETDEGSTSKSKKKKKKKVKINPNILYYPPHIIYAAVNHPNPPDKSIPAPKRPDSESDVVPFSYP